jgi:hypothetical protein
VVKVRAATVEGPRRDGRTPEAPAAVVGHDVLDVTAQLVELLLEVHVQSASRGHHPRRAMGPHLVRVARPAGCSCQGRLSEGAV